MAAELTEQLYDEGQPIAVVDHHYDDSFAHSEAEARISYIGITAFPTLIPDGLPEPTWPYTYDILLNTIETRMAADAPCVIALGGSQDGNTVTLDITVTKDDGADMPTPKVLATVIENNISHSWQGMSTVEFVNRDMLPTNTGTDITFDGNVATLQLTAELDASWDQDNIEFVVWTENGSNHHVFQATKISLAELNVSYDPPTGLAYEIQEGNNVVLTWSPPMTANGLTGYKVYRDGEEITELGQFSTTYTDEALQNGTYEYTVTAIFGSNESEHSDAVTVEINLGINDEYSLSKKSFALSNHPNPFNPTTVVNFEIKDESSVLLQVFDIKGHLVKTLASRVYTAGSHSLVWDGKDSHGQDMPSSIYFSRLSLGSGEALVHKMVLLK